MRDYPQYKLRMSPELKKQITQHAEKNNRSINAEIVLRLEQSLAQDDSENIIAFDKAWLDKNKIESDKLADALIYVINKAKERDEKNNA
nr:Arc family DNA-binding protein [uncultured Moraxella sp.]